MNHERIAKLRECILADHEHFDMDWWCATKEYPKPDFNGPVEDPTIVRGLYVRDMPETLKCGTTLCAAGWAVYLWKSEARPSEPISSAAQRILGLSDEQSGIFFEDEDVALDLLEHWSDGSW